jgi:hypothetical protein
MQILNKASNLRYLKIQSINACINKNSYSTDSHSTGLRKLIIMHFNGKFCDLVEMLKQTPNLKSLTINAPSDKDMIDAYKWKDLITSSLPFLKVFKFYFKYSRENENECILHEILKRFESDFWQKQHHWYTEYSLSKDSASIYTIPYILDTFELTSDTDRYCTESINNINTFHCVRNLTINANAITEKCPYYFSDVTSLTFRDPSSHTEMISLDIKHIDILKMIVNFWNIIHLVIGRFLKLETSFVLLKILKESPQLSSLAIHPDVLISLFDNEELCRYLNKTIKRLEITNDVEDLFWSLNHRNQVSKVFSIVEQLICRLYLKSSWLFFIEHLPKLSYINDYSETLTSPDKICWLKREVQKLGVKIISDVYENHGKKLSIWIIRDMH